MDRHIRRPLVRLAPFLAMQIAQKAMVEDRVEPPVHIAIVAAEMPAGERALESVLHEIIGALRIAPQQLAGEAPQPGDVRFDLSRWVVWHCPSPASPAAGQRPRCSPLRPQSPVGCPTLGHYFRHYWRGVPTAVITIPLTMLPLSGDSARYGESSTREAL